MACIEKRDGKFRVQIRCRGVNLSATFDTENTAQLWAMYKESLIKEMDYFQVPNEDLITLADAINLKSEEFALESKDAKSISDIKSCLNSFSEWLDYPLAKFNYDMILQKVKDMSTQMVRRGGYEEKGSLRIQSPATILRKIRCLSAVFGLMVEKGYCKINPVLHAAQYLARTIKTKEL